ncbi:MAG: hypothetical protein Q9185_004164 [Variospora sp. 1 TL-2023]
MSKRTIFTTITALPRGITRETVLETLHNHFEMIDLNPLVIERHPVKAPRKASPEEFHSVWYHVVDKYVDPPVKGLNELLPRCEIAAYHETMTESTTSPAIMVGQSSTSASTI